MLGPNKGIFTLFSSKSEIFYVPLSGLSTVIAKPQQGNRRLDDIPSGYQHGKVQFIHTILKSILLINFSSLSIMSLSVKFDNMIRFSESGTFMVKTHQNLRAKINRV